MMSAHLYNIYGAPGDFSEMRKTVKASQAPECSPFWGESLVACRHFSKADFATFLPCSRLDSGPFSGMRAVQFAGRNCTLAWILLEGVCPSLQHRLDTQADFWEMLKVPKAPKELLWKSVGNHAPQFRKSGCTNAKFRRA